MSFDVDKLLKKKRYIALLVIGVLIILGFQRLSYSMQIGYMAGYQGLQAQFDSVFFKNYWYDFAHLGPNKNYVINSESQTASAGEFFDRVNLDPDYSTTHMPNLGATQSPVSVDLDYGTKIYGPWRIKVGEETKTQSNASHTWTTTTEIFKEFQIIRYRCVWSVNVWLSGDYNEATPSEAHTWRDAQLWIKLVPQNFVYFKDNPDKVYFAPAKIQLVNLEWWSIDKTGKESKDASISQYQDLIPEARGETLGIYYARGGQSVDVEQNVLRYQNALLDPNIFRSEYWVYLSLQVYRPYSWWNDFAHLTGWSYQFPSAKMDFEVFVFCVGEWTVKLEQSEVTELEVHEPQEVQTSPFQGFWDWITGVGAWLSNPFTQLGLGVFGLIAIAIVSLILFSTLAGKNLILKLFRRKKE